MHELVEMVEVGALVSQERTKRYQRGTLGSPPSTQPYRQAPEVPAHEDSDYEVAVVANAVKLGFAITHSPARKRAKE